jgi:histidinol dehydrogenase
MQLVAADLLAQAEHDVDAVPILVALSEDIVRSVEVEVTAQLAGVPYYSELRCFEYSQRI